MIATKIKLLFALLVTSALSLATITAPCEAAPPQGGPGPGWMITDEAAFRTLAGECPANTVCYEYCDEGGPTGNFQCGYPAGTNPNTEV